MAKNALLLDLDGTVREPRSGQKFINVPTDQQLMEGVAAAIERYVEAGWALYGVTNQGGVIAGHKSLQSMLAEQLITMELCPALEAVFFCPDWGDSYYVVYKNGEIVAFDGKKDPQVYCAGQFRKPQAGMLKLALHHHAARIEGIGKVMMVGDRPEDKEAAQNAEVPFLDASEWRKGYGKASKSEV